MKIKEIPRRASDSISTDFRPIVSADLRDTKERRNACCRLVSVGSSARDLSALSRAFFPPQAREERSARSLGLASGVCHVKLTPSARARAILCFFFFHRRPHKRSNGRLLRVSGVLGDGGRRSRASVPYVCSLVRCSISRAYKSRMGGTDMERHRRGWKETRLSKQRLVEFIAGRRRRDRSLRLSRPSFPLFFAVASFTTTAAAVATTLSRPLTFRPRRTLAAVLAGPPSAPPPTYLDIKAR